MARQYNLNNEFLDTDTYFIKVNINGIGAEGQNLQSISVENKKTALIDKYSLKSDNKTPQYFECIGVTINQASGVVNSITFQIIP